MYASFEDVRKDMEKDDLPFWECVLANDMMEEAITREESMEKMGKIYQAMIDADRDYDPGLMSSSGLVGSDGAKLQARREHGDLLAGDLIGKVMERALKMGESNACMKRIVAAPTAGSCGVLPAVLLTVQEARNLDQEKMVEAMYVAAGIGSIIAERASLSGAEGGCQAEIGSASAMAAGALAYLEGGAYSEISHAAAIALKGLLGLVCDPVAGLVEVPCVKRNVIGAVNAVTSADMAMAGIQSRIPPDQVIDAMKSVGHALPQTLRETGKGGLAATPAAMQIRDRIIM